MHEPPAAVSSIINSTATRIYHIQIEVSKLDLKKKIRNGNPSPVPLPLRQIALAGLAAGQEASKLTVW